MKHIKIRSGYYAAVPDDHPAPAVALPGRPTPGAKGDLERISRIKDAFKHLQEKEAKEAKAAATVAKFIPNCIYLGDSLGKSLPCDECGNGSKRVPLYACSVHGECTQMLRVKGKKCCTKGCKERQLAPPTPPPAISVKKEKAILITGGLGDAITLDTLMTPEERSELETIYYACPAWQEIAALFKAVPQAYPKLTNHVSLKPLKTYYRKEEVEADHGKIDADDWSIATIFPKGRPYTGCSFLEHKLAEARTIDRPYVVCTPYSTWGRWKNRNFGSKDWGAMYDFLALKDLVAVVLVKGGDHIPPHPRVINLANQTSILESMEILKNAVGYVGIDTWISVPATKIKSFKWLAVKCRNQQCYDCKHIYFAPRTSFGFLDRVLNLPRR